MILQLKRKWFTSNSVMGELYADDKFICFTLEDAFHEHKVQNETCIPFGTYDVILDESVRFKRMMPHVMDVPDYEGVRIHWGNWAKNTEGCVLVGLNKDVDVVYNSRKAFDQVYQVIENGLAKDGKVQITISDERL